MVKRLFEELGLPCLFERLHPIVIASKYEEALAKDMLQLQTGEL